MATHSSVLAWRIPGMAEPGELPSLGSHRVGHREPLPDHAGESTLLSQLCRDRALQLCPTLCDPRDGSSPGSAVPGILQARTLEWVAISFSNA